MGFLMTDRQSTKISVNSTKESGTQEVLVIDARYINMREWGAIIRAHKSRPGYD